MNRLNGDGHLRIDQRLAWLAFNAIDNRQPYRGVDPDVMLADFRCADAVERLAGFAGTPSPSRALSDMFWMRAPWARMERELGPLRIFDLGCGSGEYGVKFSEWSGGRVARYVGVDLRPHPRWAELTRSYTFVDFREGDVERLGEIVPPDTNVIVSQSTLEHVRDDAESVAQLAAFAGRAGHRLWQIHLVPSQACLHLYLWHGYRQYTPRTLSETTRPLAASERWVVRLGGAQCNRLHWKFVTWPLLIRGQGDLREKRPAEYRAALAAAITRDMAAPQRSPSFYAIVVAPHAGASDVDCWHRAPP
jgi:SAM-dependent methyltransferase